MANNPTHSKRLQCVNARCRAWVRVDRFPICPSCRLAAWGGGLILLVLQSLLAFVVALFSLGDRVYHLFAR